MENTYVYRKHLRHMPKVIIGMIILTLVLILVSLRFLDFMVPIFAIFLVYDIFILMFMRRFSTSSFVVTDDYFYFVNNSKEVKWTYDEIAKLDPKSIKNTGGWLNVVPKEGKAIKITVVLEDIAKLVMDLKTRLDNKDMTDKYDEQRLFKFYKTAAYSDDSWRRAYYYMPRFALISVVHIIAAIVVMVISESDILVNGIFAATFISMVVYIILEYGVFARKIGKETESTDWKLPEADLKFEKKKMNIPLYVQGVMFLLSFLLLLLL